MGSCFTAPTHQILFIFMINNLIDYKDSHNKPNGNEFAKKFMTSLEISEIIGRQHKSVMRSIRNMEPAWAKVNGRKFALVEYKDEKGENRPMYELTKKECLYIATKFNDEARAKLVNRWEDLETGKATPTFQVPQTFSEALMLAAQQQHEIERQRMEIETKDKRIHILEFDAGLNESTIRFLEKRTEYQRKVLASSTTTLVTSIAQDYGMTARQFNEMLRRYKIQKKVRNQWVLMKPYVNKGYVHSKTTPYDLKDGRVGTSTKTEWTQKGRMFLYEFLKKRDILPIIEENELF